MSPTVCYQVAISVSLKQKHLWSIQNYRHYKIENKLFQTLTKRHVLKACNKWCKPQSVRIEDNSRLGTISDHRWCNNENGYTSLLDWYFKQDFKVTRHNVCYRLAIVKRSLASIRHDTHYHGQWSVQTLNLINLWPFATILLLFSSYAQDEWVSSPFWQARGHFQLATVFMLRLASPAINSFIVLASNTLPDSQLVAHCN